MKVKDLIKKLTEFDGNLVVALVDVNQRVRDLSFSDIQQVHQIGRLVIYTGNK